jgi:hypothetical protein
MTLAGQASGWPNIIDSGTVNRGRHPSR